MTISFLELDDRSLSQDSPVISKAAYLVECAHFVRKCSLGQWPEWMRINMNTFRPQDSYAARTPGNMNARLTKVYQAAAARMFYIWGEVSSSRKAWCDRRD